ncbi:MAG: hypothetical protein ACRDI2_11375 [Chloroflexota bacterium]
MGSLTESRPHENAEPTKPTDLDAGADAEHRAYVEAWEQAHPGQPFPRPWQASEEARGWRRIARGRNWPARPDTDVELEVVLSPDDNVWLARRARTAGLHPSQYIAQLVADARTQDQTHKIPDERAPVVQSA